MAESHEVIEAIIVDDGAQSSSNDGKDLSNPCKLCLEEITGGNKFTLERCGCFFCIDCMKTYVEVLVKDGIALQITCPDSECVIQGYLQVHEVKSLVGEETFEKYSKMKYEQEIAIDPKRTFCPNPGCSHVCSLYSRLQGENAPTYKQLKKIQKMDLTLQPPMRVDCPMCRFTFCHICKSNWSSGHTCHSPATSTVKDEIKKIKVRAGLSTNGPSDAAIKRCPVCGILIEKDRGCAQMICKNCSHVFCWYCLELLDNDFMLRHYDNGPCKNFLGHSRSQVLRHRLGVIGLFTAFSILLIVASPILLLAAPIFLCCKWKECCARAWRRAQQENNNALFVDLGMEPRQHTEPQRQDSLQHETELISRLGRRTSIVSVSSITTESRQLEGNLKPSTEVDEEQPEEFTSL